MPNEYWRSIESLERSVEPDGSEFVETPIGNAAGPDRRGFLKAAGFTFAGAFLTGCSRRAEKIVPNLQQPEGFVPGRPVYYTSACRACPAGCGTLVKVRDGRPIKLEGNPGHPVSRGGLCAAGQASLLGLYDSQRVAQPLIDGKAANWSEADAYLLARLEDARRSRARVRVLTSTIHSPAEAAWIRRFLATLPDAQHIEYDALSSAAILDAHEQTFGVRILPRYRFDNADVIVSIDADFLGTWISPVEHTAGYAEARNAERKRFAWHAQVESRMSLSGTKADRRIVLPPLELAAFVLELRDAVRTGESKRAGVLDLARRLTAARGRSLVVCGLQQLPAQVACNEINQTLGSYGATVEFARASRQRRGDDRALERLLRELRDGKVELLVTAGVNPVYDLPGGDAVSRARLLVACAGRLDETASRAHVVCAMPDPLEAWSDSEPLEGVASIVQPCIQPLFQTRPFLETLAVWSGVKANALDLVRDHWRREIYPKAKTSAAFDQFWDAALEAGFAEYEIPGRKLDPTRARPTAAAADTPPSTDGFTLILYAKPALLDGRHAYNPWLQELPDPVTKVAWDNYASIAPAAAARLGIAMGDVVRIQQAGQSLELPALIQPGQDETTVAVALGYGSRLSTRFAKVGPQWLEARPLLNEAGLVGGNAAPMLRFAGGSLEYFRPGVSVSKTGRTAALACTQEHHGVTVPANLVPGAGAGRPDGPDGGASWRYRRIVQETTVAEVCGARNAPNEPRPELWPQDHPYSKRRWAMVVDLNACTGCSACVVACQAENNIPVVGKDEMRRTREMHWMRIDRYYSGDPESPRVAHQPMFCQQCEHAPCETVCPVLATAHSEEGLNQQTYNRCVGTRYCANNCPYKVRRFNWFAYAREDRMANLVLNPDVTVRSRGVMEKCTFCVQRIQEAKIQARLEGRPVHDEDVQTACQQSCPANAIVFGNLNDPKSAVSRLMASGRRYRVLEELNVRPSVGYLKLVRHDAPATEEKHNG